MKILFKQPSVSNGTLAALGISDCYYKQLIVAQDRNNVTKTHHHTCFELHIVTKGSQLYDVNSLQYKVHAGQQLLVYPNIPHRVICSAPQTEKTSITFFLQIPASADCYFGNVLNRLQDSMTFIAEESSAKKELSILLIENRIAEMIVSVLRLSGLQEKATSITLGENTTLALAKQYIADNIANAPSVSEVSQYCYLSTKQLTRIFQTFQGISPGEYIRKERIKQIILLLVDSNLSLGQISEVMNFSSEYYFSAFFKKETGMPPGEYRKMLGLQL